MLTFFLFRGRVLVHMGTVLRGVAMLMRLHFSGVWLAGVAMLVKVPVGMCVTMLVGVDTRFMLMLMIMGMGMFMGMQVLVLRRIVHDSPSLDVDFPLR